MLENDTFTKSAKEGAGGGGGGGYKIAEKIRYLRRDVFVDDP